MEGVIESRPRDPEPRTPAPAENRNTGQRNGYHTGSPPQASHSRKAVGTRPNSMSPNWSRPAKGISRSGGKTTTPKAPGGRGRRDSKETVKQEPKSEQKPRAAPSGTGKKSEDMASIALALQLQMEEHGLRRRSK
jgi:F-box/leucine-rich repeat protein 10/11